MLASSRVRRCALLLCLPWALLAPPVAAEPTSAPASPVADGETAEQPAASAARRWYGSHVLLADAAGLVLGGALALGLPERERRPSDLGLVGSAWYGVGAVAAPAVHFAHGQRGAGMASLATRTLLPPLAGVLGLAAGCVGNGSSEASCRRSGATGGTLVGLAVAAAYDVSVLSYEGDAEPEPEAGERRWYGWELLVLDGALLLGGAYVAARGPRNDQGEKLEPQLSLWATDYAFGLFGGPIVHAVHGEWMHALASLGMRSFVGPLGAVAGLMGHCAASGGAKGCSSTGATYGLLGGLLFVDLFDAFVLGCEEIEPEQAGGVQASLSAGPGFIAISGTLP